MSFPFHLLQMEEIEAHEDRFQPMYKRTKCFAIYQYPELLTLSQCSNYRIKPYLPAPRAMTNYAKMVMVILFTLNYHRMPGNTSMLSNPVHLANAGFITYNPFLWAQRTINMLIHLLTILAAFQLVIIYRLSQ